MGYLFIQKANGETVNIDHNGNKTFGNLSLDYCDKCQTWQPKELGKFITYADEAIVWFCKECK